MALKHFCCLLITDITITLSAANKPTCLVRASSSRSLRLTCFGPSHAACCSEWTIPRYKHWTSKRSRHWKKHIPYHIQYTTMSLTKIYHNLASSWASKRPWESYTKRFFFGGNAKISSFNGILILQLLDFEWFWQLEKKSPCFILLNQHLRILDFSFSAPPGSEGPNLNIWANNWDLLRWD